MNFAANFRRCGIIFHNSKHQVQLSKIVRFSSSDTKTNVRPEKGSSGHYDVVVVGGGPAGLSMACAFAKNTKLTEQRVLLLDGGPSFKGYSPDSFSNRVYALNQSTIDLLASLGAWSTITSIRHRPIKRMQVWDSSSDAMITFQGDALTDDMAYIVENDVLVHSVLQEIEKHPNIVMQNNSKIETVQLADEAHNLGLVTLKTGEQYSCSLMIGADGANSIVRRQMGVEMFSESYNQMGVIATVNLKHTGVNETAWQRFLPNGVLAILPLAEGLSSIVWSTNTTHAKELLNMTEVNFVDAINDALFKAYPKNEFINSLQRSIEPVLSKYSKPDQKQTPPAIDSLYGNSRAAFPLAFSHSPSYVSNGTALIGDSAHRVHPLAGQGLNLGFGDVHCLTKHLADGVYNGFSIGDITPLKKYESERLRHNLPIMIGIHGIQKLYSSDLAPVVWARSLGLQVAQSIEPLKKLFINRARV